MENDGGIEQINGREGETATLFWTAFGELKVARGGFAPRHLNRYVASPVNVEYARRKISI